MMLSRLKILILTSLLAMANSHAQAATDYANPNQDYEGEYKSTHNDISTMGQSEKEPTLEQADEIRKINLEEVVKPKEEPKPDLDLTQPQDRALLNKIENGSAAK